MRLKSSVRATLLCILAAAAMLVPTPGGAAYAAAVTPTAAHPAPISSSVAHGPSKGKPTPNSLSGGDGGPGCTAAANPQPQLSGGFVHWGVKVTCDVPEQVSLDVILYTYHGANTVYEDEIFASGVGFVIATAPRSTQCVGTTPTYWVFEVTFTSPDLVWTPNPAWSPTVNLACGGLPD
jgi:hypothetical protein